MVYCIIFLYIDNSGVGCKLKVCVVGGGVRGLDLLKFW